MHLNELALQSYVDDELTATCRNSAKQHLDTCAECRRKILTLLRIREETARLLSEAPEPRFSTEFRARTFADAFAVLNERKALASHRRRAQQARTDFLRNWLARIDLRPIVLNPAFQFSILALFLGGILIIQHSGQERWPGRTEVTRAPLEESDRENHFGTEYETTWKSQQLAYEREVEDAHQATRGGRD